ncbi:cobalt-precorrin-6A reductase [Paramaledivibacter caminithermalis]|jgi:precorrin-6A/cobalt-precorrin-6A reductase|uniref:Precorrin-6A/cobalt-precorrin-6A reductase n=1 Tax=Paramaledivibacter caminithermalis (strain DSM 15212 / CIP 107654 / DViRD3) TaxID=1121301 RepID=A0A1M6MLL1_PARC5|nr:cobalt-precorrin-6A reductase [Paramaledivibacter caminithermalis]SHJ84163.1 precorrin-6A/cobalt-precorrin-6A reductase [Paramaledivibacter caminithermalis DSM 15212]
MILVLSGTKDGRDIVYKLRDKGFNILVTTATNYGKSLYKQEEGLRIISNRLDYDGMVKLIKENSIKLAIDATHPYADKVSDNISKACKEIDISYIRYQRRESSLSKYDYMIKWAKDYEEAAEMLARLEGNILLTTGSKTLDIFTSKLSPKRLYPRVLPTSDVLEKCEDLGFKPSNIIAMQGPFTKEMNKELIRKYDIRILVTKDSGKIGGTDEKLAAAEQMGIPVIIISRPEEKQGLIFNDVDKLINKVSEIYG